MNSEDVSSPVTARECAGYLSVSGRLIVFNVLRNFRGSAYTKAQNKRKLLH